MTGDLSDHQGPITLGLARIYAFISFAVISGFIFCLVWTYINNFETATSSHCKVFNVAPSISASIGTVPQKYIWQFVVTLQFVPKLFLNTLYFHYLNQRLQNSASSFELKLHACFGITEAISLVGLTLVSSVENFLVHKIFFGIFIFCGLCYMCMTVYLLRPEKGYQPNNLFERLSIQRKQFLLKSSLILGGLMMFLYWRHTKYCEPLVYSFFGMCEYLFVLFNIFFHMTAYYDFGSNIFIIMTSSTCPNVPQSNKGVQS